MLNSIYPLLFFHRSLYFFRIVRSCHSTWRKSNACSRASLLTSDLKLFKIKLIITE